ncbi:MAG: cyanophycinase [Acidobacteria bacterium]|nr:cyanophycinase [Acidobacteriota bacterium]
MKAILPLLLMIAAVSDGTCLAQNTRFRYIRLGSDKDVGPRANFGLALMGGGSDLDEAFRWLCNNGRGGDFLILRATGNDSYNAYVKALCRANSVATLIIPNRASAQQSAVADIIRKAEVVFIAGGDQANYTRNWTDTPVEDALNQNIAAGKPIGGTSAGLAVLGEYTYSAEGDKPDDADLTSPQVLADPFNRRLALRRHFLNIDLLANTLTDTHFAKRDRMGRSIAFLARIVADGWSAKPREVAVDEKSAVLVERSGRARVIGSGQGAYFVSPQTIPEDCRQGTPLTFRDIAVYHAPVGSEFNLEQWRGTGGGSYSLSVISGRVQSTQAGGEVY